jgi:hypothetical protein
MNATATMRTVLTSMFVLLMLASGHLFMVVVNHAESSFAAPRAADGLVARMFNDRPMTEEIQAALRKTSAPEKRALLQGALKDVEAGRPLELHVLPVTRFLVGATLALTVIGAVLLWATSRLKGDAPQSILGIFGGSLIWTGGVEYGLTIAARALGVGKTIAVVNGQLVATYGEYVLLKHTWGVLALVMVYLLFLESSRCPVFLWWRKNVPTMRGDIVTGRIDNYGPRSGFQYATTVWGFYLLLLWAYDEHVFGVYSLFTKATLVLSIAGTIYCTWRLHNQPSWGSSIRYAVGAMILAWTPVEIIGKWGLLREPWLLLRPEALAVFFGGLALGTWGLWRAQGESRKRAAEEATVEMGARDKAASSIGRPVVA